MPNISKERLEEFKAIYEKHYDIQLTDSELLELAEKFTGLMKHLLFHNPKKIGTK